MNIYWLNKVLRVIPVLLLAPLIFIVYLLLTESGLHLIYKYAKSYIPENITIDKLEGNFIGPIILHNVQYKNNNILIQADQLSIDWLPAKLFSKNIHVNHLYIQSLKSIITSTKSNIQNKNTDNHYTFNLPWNISLNDVVVNEFSITQNDRLTELQQIKLNIKTLADQLSIKSLSLINNKSQLNLSGIIKLTNDYQHNLNINWQALLPENKFIRGKGYIRGDANSLNIQQHVSGPVQLSFNAELRDILNNVNWQAEANITEINPSEIWNKWPGQLKGKITSQGRTDSGQLIANFDIENMQGKLRGYPVLLVSRLNWRNSGLDINQLDLNSGKTRLNAKGRMDSLLNINWSLKSSNLAELYPESQGSIQMQGRLRGPLSAPISNISFTGTSLRYSDYKISNIKANIGFDLFNYQQINILMDAKNLKYKAYDLNILHLNANNHSLQISASNDKATALISLKGDTNTNGIQGTLERAEVKSSQYFNWALLSPVQFNLSKEQYVIDPLCWKSSEAKLCAKFNKINASWQTTIEATQFPLMAFSSLLHPDLKIKGNLNARAEMQFQSEQKPTGAIHITLPPGELSYPLLGNDYEHLSYRGGNLDFTVNANELKATTDIVISKEEHLKGEMTLPDANIFSVNTQKQPILANAELNIQSLRLLEILLPEIHEVKGVAGLNFKISGTLAKPKLSGSAYLNNGSLRIPRLGLTIDKINFKSQNDGNERLDFKLTASSGDGNLDITGQTNLDSQSGWPTSIIVKGDNFEISHIPVSQVRVSPELKIKLHKRTIDISGQVHIPYAKLQPKDITAAAHVSDDSVILGEKQLAEEKWLIYTKVRLLLGERVNFYGFGFEGRFSGNLLLEDEPGQITKASGEINIPEGRYAAYGQRLEVEFGRLLYSGSPIVNPGIDLRAVRRLETVTAGLKVRGTLNHPQVELFSIPAMGQTDTLSYLLLGRPIENASGNEGKMMAKAALALSLIGGDSLARSIGDRFGFDEMRVESSSTGEQASLVIGRYLSPKLYVGYGVGLIESFHTLNVRYQISDRWQLKAESGENQGADLLYTIER